MTKDSIEIMINNLENLWLEHQALPNETKADKDRRNKKRNRISALEKRILVKLTEFDEMK